MDKDFLASKIKNLLEQGGGYDSVSNRMMLTYLFALLSLSCENGKEIVTLDSSSLEINEKIPKRDIYILNGIKKIGIPSNSYVEIKHSLISDTLYRELSIAKKYKKIYPDSLCALVYKQSQVSDELLKKIRKEKAIRVFSCEDFIAWISKNAKVYNLIESSEREWKTERKQIIDNAKQSFRDNNVSFFLGAGVTQSAGGLSWNELLYKIYKYTHKNVKVSKKDIMKMLDACGNSNIVMGRYVMSEGFKKNNLSNYLRRYVLYDNLQESDLIESICEAVSTKQLESIITYNYDDLVETAIERKGISVARVYCKSRNYRAELPVYHVHGLVTQQEEYIDSTPILSERDYHDIYRETFNWSNVEQLHALDRNTCFFIGLSMTDPNLRRLLDFSRKGSDGDACHYAFLQRESLYKSIDRCALNEQHFRKIEDQMHSFGISVIWFENFDEIPQILRTIIKPLELMGTYN